MRIYLCRFRLRNLKWGLCLFISFCLALYLTFLLINNDSVRAFESRNHPGERPLKSILVWNAQYRIETSAFGYGGPDTFAKHGCPVVDCELVLSRKFRPVESYDAIIIHMQAIWKSHLPEFNRRPEQRLIFLSQEPPTMLPLMKAGDYDGYFNWTMTYKPDSDILLMYGRVSKLNDSGRHHHNTPFSLVNLREFNSVLIFIHFSCSFLYVEDK